MRRAFWILVTGSRDWTDRAVIYGALDMYASADELQQPITLHHGDCRTGADAIADTWALTRRVAVIRHPAKWREHGVYNPQAGLARNRLMVELGPDVCLAFIRNGSRGATHCADLAEAAGIPTRRFIA